MKLTVKTADGAIDRELSIDSANTEDLANLLGREGITLNRRCGGDGSCGGCNVIVEDGSYEMRGKQFAANADRHRNILACQSRVSGENIVLRIPSRSLLEVSGEIETDFEVPLREHLAALRTLEISVPPPSLNDHRSEVERISDALSEQLGGDEIHWSNRSIRNLPKLGESGRLSATVSGGGNGWDIVSLTTETAAKLYGVAIDIGTTTVAGLLIEPETGEIVQKATRYNQQILRADDVASRISFADTKDALDELQRLVVKETINPIIDSLCFAHEIEREQIGRVAIAGNTVMTHLLLGLPVESIGSAPFSPLIRAPKNVKACDLSLPLKEDVVVDVLPAISGYVGGDITADIYVSKMNEKPAGSLLLDLGTNCEMVLRANDGLVACSTPAGPAFEGGGLLHGMRATDGAISHVRIGADYKFDLASIGKRRKRGLCGSAVIDFISEAFHAGLINRAGRFNISLLQAIGRLKIIVVDGRDVKACLLVDAKESEHGEDIVITEKDISEVLQAKSAVFAGLKTLLNHCEWQESDIPELILAGGFARHIDLENAMRIGLLPRLSKERVTILGNGSLAGSYCALTDCTAVSKMHALHKMPRVVELNLIPEFEGNFIDSLYLPRLSDGPQLLATG